MVGEKNGREKVEKQKSRKVEMSVERGFRRLTFVVSILCGVYVIFWFEKGFCGYFVVNWEDAVVVFALGFIATWAIFFFLRYIVVPVIRYVVKGFKREK